MIYVGLKLKFDIGFILILFSQFFTNSHRLCKQNKQSLCLDPKIFNLSLRT